MFLLFSRLVFTYPFLASFLSMRLVVPKDRPSLWDIFLWVRFLLPPTSSITLSSLSLISEVFIRTNSIVQDVNIVVTYYFVSRKQGRSEQTAEGGIKKELG